MKTAIALLRPRGKGRVRSDFSLIQTGFLTYPDRSLWTLLGIRNHSLRQDPFHLLVTRRSVSPGHQGPLWRTSQICPSLGKIASRASSGPLRRPCSDVKSWGHTRHEFQLRNSAMHHEYQVRGCQSSACLLTSWVSTPYPGTSPY